MGDKDDKYAAGFLFQSNLNFEQRLLLLLFIYLFIYLNSESTNKPSRTYNIYILIVSWNKIALLYRSNRSIVIFT
jgi:hypothetical protein